MAAGYLELNQSIGMSMGVEDGAVWAKSRVMDLRGEAWALVAVPSVNGVGVPLRVGAEVDVVTTSDSATWTVRARVVGREFEPVPGLLIETQGPPTKIQRREFARVPCLINVELEWTDVLGGHFVRGAAVDLSGGGLSLAIRSGPGPCVGVAARATFALPDHEGRFAFRTRIARAEGSVAKGWSVGLEFGSITVADRDLIVAYCLQRQKELQARGFVRRGP